MKIVEQTPTVLVLQVNRYNTLLALGAGSLIYLLISFAAVFYFGLVVTLTCNRIEAERVSCEVNSVSLREQNKLIIPLGQLQSAEVEESESEDEGHLPAR